MQGVQCDKTEVGSTRRLCEAAARETHPGRPPAVDVCKPYKDVLDRTADGLSSAGIRPHEFAQCQCICSFARLSTSWIYVVRVRCCSSFGRHNWAGTEENQVTSECGVSRQANPRGECTKTICSHSRSLTIWSAGFMVCSGFVFSEQI